MIRRKNMQPVTPGDRLGVIEEFSPGAGTYVNNGVIYSKTTGYATVNRENKKINIFQKTKVPVFPGKGQVVVGKVQQVQDKLAFVKLIKADGFELKKPFTAVLHVSFVSTSFTKTVFDAFKPGDFIRAQIIGDENLPYQLTTAGKEFGVLQAFCSKCGNPLNLVRRQLICPNCGNVEKRKISELYGKDF
ncbi:RNA-binding protein [Candidatus Bathyarchaeota archaeon]|nr:MAG: RNA-binding protein [Candidatus Bathyarchaeota archaeon]